MPPDRPLLVMPPPVRGTAPTPTQVRGGGASNPKKGRQIERLGPKFDALRTALDERRAALQTTAGGAPLEQVLVLETNGPVQNFLAAVRDTPGLAWLGERDEPDLDPDEDFQDAKKPTKKLVARLYMIMTNQEALGQLLSVWKEWLASRRGKKASAVLTSWVLVFRCLRDIREWGVKDRIEETGIREQWNEAIAMGASAMPVELELWCRDDAASRARVEARVRSLVETAGGSILSSVAIPDIAYHAVLAEIPRSEVERILGNQDVALVAADDLRLMRPTPQISTPILAGESDDAPSGAGPQAPFGDPVVALLDGLPVENHSYLAGRLTLDDPDGFSQTYPLTERFHGTAMASLILHGDLSSPGPALSRRLYVRPILRPRDTPNRPEMAPREQLWVDLVHRAVRRMIEGESGQAPAAPGVRIVNFSVGDSFQPFLHSMSPLARLLDWLAWKYHLLFVVSAGNHREAIRVSASPGETVVSEATVIKAIHDDHRNRRLLAPAEAVNVLTVGSAHEDEAGSFQSPSNDQQPLVVSEGLPSPLSALGRGFRKSVKPDVLAAGGRAIYTRRPGGTDGVIEFDLADGPKLPGQRAAAPGATPGDLGRVRFSSGTSNAAALTTRAAAQILDALDELREGSDAANIQGLPVALVTKALLVHTATWDPSARAVIEKAIRTKENASYFRDLAAGFMGYGRVRPERAIACTATRATLIGGGFIRPDEQWLHTIPLPAAFHAQRVWRRITMTLAYFTPINPVRREYRRVVVRFFPPRENVLRADGVDVDGKAVTRGSVQHEVLEGDSSAMNIGINEAIDLPVSCVEDASMLTPLPADGVPYALAVTIETAPEIDLPIYEQVRARVQPVVQIAP